MPKTDISDRPCTRRAALLLGALALLIVALAAAPAAARADTAAPTCAGTTTADAHPAQSGTPCWSEITPYPFGTDGSPVDTSDPRCSSYDANGAWTGDFAVVPRCYLNVTSMVFRAWNRGVAATNSTSLRVWVYRGRSWYPDPTYPGASTCPGDTLVWAGKLDYWLVGGAGWKNLCRFDGSTFEWQPVPVPTATLARLVFGGAGPFLGSQLASGSVQRGSCSAWNDCWFAGDAGVILHWDGSRLVDAGAPADAAWLQAGFTDVATTLDASGKPVGLAVANRGRAVRVTGAPDPRPLQPDGTAAPTLFSLTDDQAIPTASPDGPLADGTAAAAALALGTGGAGWLAADPYTDQPQRVESQLLPISAAAGVAPCQAPGAGLFSYLNGDAKADNVWWTRIAVDPTDGDALAGGLLVHQQSGLIEPIVASVSCATGAVKTTLFRTADPRNPLAATVPAAPWQLPPYGFNPWTLREARVSALAATAPNDGWLATDPGRLSSDPSAPLTDNLPPRLYRLTDGTPPASPAGDDAETRPVPVQSDPITYVFVPYETPPPPKNRVLHPKPSIYGVRVRLSGTRLTVSFKVRQNVVIGLRALRGKRIVAHTGLIRFRRGRHHLVLVLDPRHWPTKVTFATPKRAR